jgi:DNA-binding transcriptional LysR family regulator
VSRRLVTLQRSLYASPSYAQRWPLPHKPQEVLRCRVVTLEAYAEYGELTLQRAGRSSSKQTVGVEGHISVNSMTLLRQLLLSGAGIGLVPDRLMHDDVQHGRAVRVLPGWQAPAVEAHVLYRSRTLLPRRVRLFVEHLVQSLDKPLLSVGACWAGASLLRGRQ